MSGLNLQKPQSSVPPVIEKFHRLILWVMPKLSKFPKDKRYLSVKIFTGRLCVSRKCWCARFMNFSNNVYDKS